MFLAVVGGSFFYCHTVFQYINKPNPIHCPFLPSMVAWWCPVLAILKEAGVCILVCAFWGFKPSFLLGTYPGAWTIWSQGKCTFSISGNCQIISIVFTSWSAPTDNARGSGGSIFSPLLNIVVIPFNPSHFQGCGASRDPGRH